MVLLFFSCVIHSTARAIKLLTPSLCDHLIANEHRPRALEAKKKNKSEKSQRGIEIGPRRRLESGEWFGEKSNKKKVGLFVFSGIGLAAANYHGSAQWEN